MIDLILIFIILLLPLIAEIKVKSSYNKNLKINNNKNITGQEVASLILNNNGLSNIYVVETGGTLSDHYDPKRKVVRLSHDVYHGTSISSLAIAAHEVGHALQDKEGYTFFRIRSAIYPVVNIATRLSYYIIIIGFILGLLDLVLLGIGCTAMGLLFQLVTLPVEFNASRRAEKEIVSMNLSDSETHKGVHNVLVAAALTYVAGVLASIAQILRLLLSVRRDD